MKALPPRFHSRAALTWIEVIVGLSVIAVLIYLLSPADVISRPSARKAKAGTVVKNIINACKAYENEYGSFPAIPAARDGSAGPPPNTYLSFGDTVEGGCKVDNSELFNVLRAIAAGTNTGDVLNTRKVRYFEDARAANPKHPREGFTDGPGFPPAMRGRLMDPWGTEYCVVLDTDGDDLLYLGAFFQDLGAPEKAVRSSAAAFSMSKDGKRGGKNHEGMFRRPNSDDAPDDIVSWW